jgi:solute carrier family 25 (mitochondrial oxoglutarate transporter), member 11
MLRKETPLNV